MFENKGNRTADQSLCFRFIHCIIPLLARSKILSLVSFCTVSPSVCIYLGLCTLVATFWERAAHSVNRMFTLLCLFVALIVSHFGFEGGTLVLIASVPDHCLPFPF